MTYPGFSQMSIRENVQRILNELPPHVALVAAAKTRTPEEIREAVEAGVQIIGENYIQEAVRVIEVVGRPVRFHFIGRLQGNKVKKAVELFDTIETVDSIRLALEIDKHAAAAGKTLPVLIEINSAKESQKSGVFPEQAEALIREIAPLKHIRVSGLMTMGPFLEDPEGLRPCFRETKTCFERLGVMAIPGVDMRILSMGMSDSYTIAIEEGANQVRIGTALFGPRPVR
jgi:pyridoxal phosphate enzyme (YggS family)